MTEFDENGDVAKVKITVIRGVESNGPLFPKYTIYTAVIVIWDMDGNFKQLTKDYGRTTFPKVEKALENTKQEWLAKGLTEDKIRIDFTSCKPS